jgi:hypothetical protein
VRHILLKRTGFFQLVLLLLALLTPLRVSGATQAGGPSTSTYLPIVFYHPFVPPSQEIWGRASQNGQFVPDVPFSLLYYRWPDTGPTSQTSTTSDASGVFAFDNVPGAGESDFYMAEFTNTTDPNRLRSTYLVFGAQPGAQISLGLADITNVPLYEPANGLHVTLPFTFTWGARAASPKDVYLFVMFDPADDHHSYQTITGHNGFLKIDSLPYSIEYGVEYQWQIHFWVNSAPSWTSDTFQQFHVTFDAPNVSGRTNPSRELLGTPLGLP